MTAEAKEPDAGPEGSPSNPGDQVGPYRLLEPLGAGGMGEVWLAEDPRLGRRVALKRIRGDRGGDGFERRFRREARAVARLSHPGIVQIHDLVETGDPVGTLTIVFEYVEGPTVANLVKRGPLETSLACRLGAQVARALAAAHARGIVHRDLKAENVIVTTGDDGSPQAKMLDFGLVKHLQGEEELSALTADAALLGTFRSMAPEQASGGPVDHRADLFSLGVLLYEMAAGRSPFHGATPVETIDRLLRQDPEPLTSVRPDVSPAYSTLVDHLLAKSPEGRPEDAGQVADALERLAGLPRPATASPASAASTWLGEAPTGMGLPSSPVYPQPALSRSRRIAVVGVLIAVILLAGVLLWRWFGHQEPVRVAVLPPEIQETGDGAGLEHLRTIVGLAATRALTGLPGIAPIAPEQMGGTGGTPVEVGRAVAAEEILTSGLVPEGDMARLTLQRIRITTGEVLWSESVVVPREDDESLLIASTVQDRLASAFGAGSGKRDLDIRTQDFQRFIAIKQSLEEGASPSPATLEELEKLSTSSPRFLEVRLLAASAALGLYQEGRAAEHLEAARRQARALEDLAPADPRVIQLQVRVALEDGDVGAAKAAILRLERAHPWLATSLTLRSQLALQQGDAAEAARLATQAAERHPSWRNLYRLATVELEAGGIDRARDALERALTLVPGNSSLKAKFAQVELLYGDLERSAALFLELIAAGPHRSDLTNLGLVYMLQGSYHDAVKTFRQALTLAPGHRNVMLNLADALVARGQIEEARDLYKRILEDLDAATETRTLAADEQMIRAQCLARLDRPAEAVETAFAALKAKPDDGEINFQGALVLALAGENASALACARAALGLGVQPRWFSLPGLESLRQDPGLAIAVAEP